MTRAEKLAFLVLPGLALLAHLLCIQNYGYFRDELYYLACAKRLDWGYVDHPPLSVFLLKATVSLLGDSLAAIRLPVALASGATVALVMESARRLGAQGWGIWLAGVCPLLSGMYLVIFSMYTMNAFDIMIWAGIVVIVIGICQEASTLDGRGVPHLTRWIALGAMMGVGFLNKASILWLFAGLGVALLVTPYRRLLARPGPWVAVAVLLLLAAPHLAWQAQHGWPTLEFVRNAQEHKLVPIPIWAFFAQQAVVMNVLALPVIVLGVAFGFKDRRWAPLSLCFLTVLVILLVNGKSRVNYLAPAYPFVLAPGAVAFQRWIEKLQRDRSSLKRPAKGRLSSLWTTMEARYGGVPGLVFGAYAMTTAFYVPLGLPWLPPPAMVSLIESMPVQPPVEEKGPKSPMQGWADMFGWQELADTVKAVQSHLPPGTPAVAYNYGEAAALEHYGVGPVMCGHNAYWMWGHGSWDGKTAVFVNRWPEDVKQMFEVFEPVAKVHAPYAVPEQNESPVWVARGLKVPVSVFWQRIRKYL